MKFQSKYIKFEEARPAQESVITNVMKNQEKEVHVVSAPTGSGKSAIALELGERMNGVTAVAVQKVSLVKQYRQEFGVPILIGKKNYECERSGKKEYSCKKCPIEKKERCQYQIERNEALESPIVATTIAYLATNKTYHSKVNNIIVDEAHLLSGIRYDQITSPEYKLDRDLQGDPDYLEKYKAEKGERLVALQKIMGDKEDFQVLKNKWYELQEEWKENPDNNVIKQEIKGFKALNKNLVEMYDIQRKLEQIEYYEKNDNYEINPVKDRYQFQFHAKVITDSFIEGKRLIAMSGTIHPEMFCGMNFIEKDTMCYTEVASDFSPDLKTIVAKDSMYMSAKNRDSQTGMSFITNNVKKITMNHLGERGLLLCSAISYRERLFRDTDLERWLKTSNIVFYNHEDAKIDPPKEPGAMLTVSASLTMGYDGKDGLARYIVIPGFPYPSPRDTWRINYWNWEEEIGDREWKNMLALTNFIQMCGRATRHSSDASTIYLLDSRTHKYQTAIKESHSLKKILG